MAVIGSVYASLYGSRLTVRLPAGAVVAVLFLPAQPTAPVATTTDSVRVSSTITS